jgi:hypothetical protein
LLSAAAGLPEVSPYLLSHIRARPDDAG